MLIQKTDFARVTYEDGLICFQTTRAFELDEEKVWMWINLIHDIRAQLGRPYALVTRVDHRVTHNSKGIKILRAAGQKEYLMAHALVASSRPVKLLVQLIMALSPRTIHEERIFVQEESAREWLLAKQSESRWSPVAAEELNKFKFEIDPIPRPEYYINL